MKLIILVIFANFIFAQDKFEQVIDVNVGDDFTISGIVETSDGAKGNNIYVNLYDSDNNFIKRYNTSEKYYIAGLKRGSNYYLLVEKKGYTTSRYEFAIPKESEYSSLSKDFILDPLSPGSKIHFPVIPFKYKSTKLMPEIDEFLNFLTKILKDHPRWKFEIEVYPEMENESDINIDFTIKRGEELKSYFESKRVRSEITIKGHNDFDYKFPPPEEKQSKGKRYKGVIYLVIKETS